jgi:hypothetical protein
MLLVAQPSQPRRSKPLPLKGKGNPTPLAYRVEKVLDAGLAVIHVIGNKLLGPLWMTLFESAQDAIALGLLVKIPPLLGQWVLGKEFAGLDACWTGNTLWTVDRYACMAVVLSDYTLWAVLIPRILYRFYRDLRNLTKQGKGNGATQP